MSNIISKKAYSRYFDQVLSGQKTFDVRLADWKCEPDDILELIETNDVTHEPTGRVLRKKVGSIVRTKNLDFWQPAEIEEYGYQVISLLDEETEERL